jgi:FdhE protein
MADSFLAKWRRRVAAADPEMDQARAELERLAVERPGLRGPALWLRELLPDLMVSCSAAVPGASSLCEPLADLPAIPTLSQQAAHAKLAAGIPLLRGETLVVDVRAFQRRWRRACDALEAQRGDGVARQAAKAAGRGKLDPRELVKEIVAGRPESISNRAAALGIDPGLAATLVRFALFPDFVAIHAAMAAHHPSVPWERGACPTCGSGPLLGEFRGLDQFRYLRCGLCAAAWKVPRLFCPWCGSRNHRQLGYLHRDGEENQLRVATCQACGRYIKTISTLVELSPLRLWVADVSTLHLDLAAADR